MTIEIVDFEESLLEAKKMIAFDIQEALKDRLTKQHGYDEGNLQRHIFGKVINGDVVIEMPITGKYLEFGTPPHWPPFDPVEKSFPDLYGWVRRKWGKGSSDGDKENKAAVFVLARHISKFGTRPYPFIRLTMKQDFKRIATKALKDAFK